MRNELIRKDRATIYRSLSNYKKPVCFIETAKYKVRIDYMGDDNYRYASWSINKKTSEKPDIIIEHGVIAFYGSGGDHSYTFKNDGYTYECYVIEIGTDTSPPATLKISKGNKVVFTSDAKKFFE